MEINEKKKERRLLGVIGYDWFSKDYKLFVNHIRLIL